MADHKEQKQGDLHRLAEKVADTQQKPLPRGSETILLVEGEDPVRKLMEQARRAQGYTVLSAGSGEDAQNLFRQTEQSIDLLVTDVVMPGQSGPDLYRQLELEHPGLKALFISGYSERAVEQGTILENRLPFLQKPFRTSELALRVREILDKNSGE